MIADETKSEEDLKLALSEFETNLGTPVVSGELAEWIDAVKKTWDEASAQIHYHLKHLHPRQFEQIGSEDPELLPRVEQLQVEDAAIEDEREKLSTTVKRSAEHVPKLEPDEDKAQQHIKKLIEEGIAFIARVRKHETAIQTWYVEAFTRDRGTVD
jgi:hypothetical protein